MIRCIAKYKEPTIKLAATASLSAYIAVFDGDNIKDVNHPLPEDWVDTKSVMSIMKINKTPTSAT